MFMFIIHLVFNFQMFQWIFENLKNIRNTFKKIDFRSYKTKINNLKKKKINPAETEPTETDPTETENYLLRKSRLFNSKYFF